MELAISISIKKYECSRNKKSSNKSYNTRYNTNNTRYWI